MMTVTEVNIINKNNSSFGTLFEKYSARDYGQIKVEMHSGTDLFLKYASWCP